MKKTAIAALLLTWLVIPGRAGAVIGTIDPVPGSTLLLPYFEVDLGSPNGKTTLFSINNASGTAILAKVALWTDLGVRTVQFETFLTGYDVQTINLRDVFNGNLPQTGSIGQDPSDVISPKGSLSQDINFASCAGFLPPPALDASTVTGLRAAHTGNASSLLSGGCGGQALGDNHARGYVTVDTVNGCSPSGPGDAGYFGAGGSGIATAQNALWGDYYYIDPLQNSAQGDLLVSIEADETNPETSVAGQYTFYGRYVAWTAIDRREPLATTFATRYLNGGAFTGGTTLIAWRDPKVNQGAFSCPAAPGHPSWYPLSQEAIVTFDELEHPDVFVPPPFFPQPPQPALVPFPAAAGTTAVGGSGLPVPFSFGWQFLDLNQANVLAGANPPEDPLAAQAWVTQVHTASGRFSVGYAAMQFDSATAASHTAIGF